MTALRFHGPVLPSGETVELFVVDGLVTFERPAGAETAAEGWIVPGLVDAHNHLGLEDGGAVGDDEVEGGGVRGHRGPAGAVASAAWIASCSRAPVGCPVSIVTAW